MEPAWRATRSGVRIAVRLTPRAARDAVEGVRQSPGGSCIEVSVRAVPEKGAANAALVKLIAAWLGVPRSSVALAAGGRSRYKQVEITGDGAALLPLIEQARARR